MVSLDKSYLEMRYKGSVYSAHLHADEFIDSSESEKDDGEEETGLLLNRLPSVGEEEEGEEEQNKYIKSNYQRRNHQLIRIQLDWEVR